MKTWSRVALLALAACGSASKPDAKSANDANANAKKEAHESIADIAAAHGGIAALGGAGNREESSGTEIAFAGPLRLETLSKKNPPKLDGILKEWHARSPAHDTISGKADDLGLDVAVQGADDVLWIAAEVVDPKLTRSGKYGASDDHMTFTIAFPAGKGVLKAYEIGLWPGIPGSAPGAVKWTSGPNAGQKVAGAKIVENEVKGGITLEANLPWSSFPEATRVGMRAAFRWHNEDGAVIGTAGGTVEAPNDLPALPIAAEQAVVDGLLEQKGLSGTKPKIDVFADVAGDDRKERISVFGRFFTICGPGYRKGHQFFWREVNGDIVSLEPTSVTGRTGKDDLVVRRRVTNGNTLHEFLEVWSVPTNGEEPQTLFAHEIAIASADGKRRVSNSARLSSKEIEISTEPAAGWDASSFTENVAGDVEPILLPWGTVKSKTFKLEGGKFTKASEVAQAGTATPPPSSAKPGDTPSRDTAAVNVKPASADLGKQVLDAYKKDANVAAGAKPRFDIEVNMGGDSKPERVAVFGRDIVILGPGFKNGTGYARLSLTQFADEKDVTDLSAKDLTGNGAAEIIVKGVRHVKAPNGETVNIEAMFVYEVKNDALRRIFSIETGREMGQKRVQGLVQFVPAKSGKAFDIDVRAGSASGGWTKETYPWQQEKPGGQIEPLLLPWGTPNALRYVFNGDQFVAK